MFLHRCITFVDNVLNSSVTYESVAVLTPGLHNIEIFCGEIDIQFATLTCKLQQR